MDTLEFSPLLRLPNETVEALPKPVRSYIRYLEEIAWKQQLQIQEQRSQIQQLSGQIQFLETQVHELQDKLSKNSTNSGKPPSSDGLKRKPKSQRGKSGKKQGGQKGRKGKNLLPVKNPDRIVAHAAKSCSKCGTDLASIEGICSEKRQVFDIPKPIVQVTEHQALQKVCPCCSQMNKGIFPENVRGPVQYGDKVRALIAYFSHHHFIPVDRICSLMKDIFDLPLSPGTCCRIDNALWKHLESFEESLKAHLLGSRVLHFDETSMRCEKKLHWVHVASSELAALYTIHPKRGGEGMKQGGVLPDFKGIGVHDHWYPYFSYNQMVHSLCNAHHLRELTFIHEQKKEGWAKEMIELLIFAKKEVANNIEKKHLPREKVIEIEERYNQILSQGFSHHKALPPLPKGKRGRKKQREGKNLLDRLKDKKECVLQFLNDFSVPFTNNQGEQDIRMMKVKQKISGCFRNLSGGQIFCRVRSYIVTARKRNWNIWEALSDAIRGSPRLMAPIGNQPLPI